MQVTLVEREPRLGGVCLLRGCIPSKALLHVAKTMAEADALGEWGVAFDPPRINLDALRGRKRDVIHALAGGLAQLAKRRKVRVIRGRASLEDCRTLRLEPIGDVALEDTRIRFEHCILATGSRAATIPGYSTQPGAAVLHPQSGAAVPRVMDSTGALELPDVPESLLVVGGGYIGLELGTVYAALGARVSVVEMTDSLLPGVDRNLVKPLHKRLGQMFEAIHLNTTVTSLSDKGDAVEVVLEGAALEGNAEQPVRSFGRVLVAVGRRPNTEGLALENTNVRIDRRGFIVVDDRLRTAEESILAIGDVAGEPALAHKAAHQGKMAVESLAGEATTFAPRAIPAVVFTDPEIAWAGLTETEAKAQGRKVDVAQFPWVASGRAASVGRTEGLTKWLIDPTTDRVVGCGIVGHGAGELIGEAVLAIEMGATAGDVAKAIHPHPTLSETLGAAAEVYLGTATDLYRPKRKR
jgi:dihydrolipoamide dehydrogenase